MPIVLSVHPSNLPDWREIKVDGCLEIFSRKKSKTAEDAACPQSTPRPEDGGAEGSPDAVAESTEEGRDNAIPGSWPDDTSHGGDEVTTLGDIATSAHWACYQVWYWCIFLVVLCRQMVSRRRS